MEDDEGGIFLFLVFFLFAVVDEFVLKLFTLFLVY